ncbi:MAG: hypothetical protein A2Y78_00245 [Acidobacteria bacterium RBG_13_68_16]|nr:MAG: hypothetical protein A2Y78_00245 [Acidobacteria bacterium RBG_13_68_16]
MMNPESVKAALEALTSGDAAAALAVLESMLVDAIAGEAEATVDTDALAEVPPPPADETEEEVVKAKLIRLTAEHEALQRRVAELDARQARADAAERAQLVGDLVKLGVELPGTAWQDPDAGVPVERLRVEALSDLRGRVALHRAARPIGVRPPTAPVVELTAAEQAAADKIPAGPARDRFIALRRNTRKA